MMLYRMSFQAPNHSHLDFMLSIRASAVVSPDFAAELRFV